MTDPLDIALRQLAQEIDDNAPSPHPWQELPGHGIAVVGKAQVRHRRLALTVAAACIAVGGIVAMGLVLRGSDPSRRSTVVPAPRTDSITTDLPAFTSPAETTDALPDETSTSAATATSPPTSTAQPPGQGVPTFIVDDGSDAVTIAAASYCIPGVCADGVFDPATFHEFAASDHLIVASPMEWPLTATFRRHGQTCAPAQQVAPVETTLGSFRLDPTGVAGTYDVTLFAQGQIGDQSTGDAVATIVWTTTADGPLAQPTARVAVLADHDGTLDSYGVELSVDNMATQPATASATIDVTSAEGASITLGPTVVGGGPDCPSGLTGSLYFKLDAATGQQAAALGTAPFIYDVTLVLDGTTYVAHATWPTDEIPDNAPSVALHFNPPLPALSAAASSSVEASFEVEGVTLTVTLPAGAVPDPRPVSQPPVWSPVSVRWVVPGCGCSLGFGVQTFVPPRYAPDLVDTFASEGMTWNVYDSSHEGQFLLAAADTADGLAVQVVGNGASLETVLAMARSVARGGVRDAPVWKGQVDVDTGTGTVSAEGFNTYVDTRQPVETRTAEGTARMLVGSDDDPDTTTVVSERPGTDGRTLVTLTTSHLPDDSGYAVQYQLQLEQQTPGDTLFRFISGTWTQQCQPGRGHQDFTTEPCV